MPQRLGWRVGVHESLMFDRVEIRRDAGFEREEAPTLRYLLLDFCHSYMFEPCRRDMGVEWFVKENYHYCRITLLIDRSAFCGINESGMFAGLEFGVPCFSRRRLSERLFRPLALVTQ